MYDRVGSDDGFGDLRRYCESSSHIFQLIGESRRNSKVYDIILSSEPAGIVEEDLRIIYTDIDNLYEKAFSFREDGVAVFLDLDVNNERCEWIYCDEECNHLLLMQSTLLFCIENNERLKDLYSCDGNSTRESVKCLYLPKVIFFEEKEVSDSTDGICLDVIAIDKHSIDDMTGKEYVVGDRYIRKLAGRLNTLLSVAGMKTIETIVICKK